MGSTSGEYYARSSSSASNILSGLCNFRSPASDERARPVLGQLDAHGERGGSTSSSVGD